MYILKKKLKIKNQKKFANEIGISNVFLSNIQNRKKLCRKVIAYAIVKHYDINAEIQDYFKI